MKKSIKFIIAIVVAIATAVIPCAGHVMASNSIQEGAEAARAEGMPAELIGDGGVINQFTNIVLYIVGFISVVMLIWGGIRYIISGGDSKKITDAKNTILYAIIGLIIAVLAFAIVNFVLNAIGSVTTTPPPSENAFILFTQFIG